MTTVDPAKIKPVPIPKTLLLLNNFIVSTSSFLNEFAEACESKISSISSKVNELEILLAVLEAKLTSIPGLDSVGAGSLPTLVTETQPSQPIEVASAPESIKVSEPQVQQESTIKDNPDYAPFFKMLRVGVPLPVVQAKAAAAGLDPSLLENPEAPASAASQKSAGPKPVSRIIFDKYDADGSGDISINELQAMAMQFGVWLSGDALDIAMKTIDHNGDGKISYEEFLNWYKQNPSFRHLALDDVTLQRRQALAKVFTNYDTDNSGSLSREEFGGLYQQLRHLGLTAKSLDVVIADIDADLDGLIQFNELVNWLDRQS